MSATQRQFHPRLIRRLREEPQQFEFFQAVRLLLGYARRRSGGGDQDILGQTIRFRNSISLAFPASEIEALSVETQAPADGDETQPPHETVVITPAFIGLTGPLGVLPRHYTQHLAEREMYHRDKASRAFLDIFTTRAVSLFYQSWLKYRLHFQYETDRKNRYLPLVLSLAGLGLGGTRDRLHESGSGVADESLAYYVSALRQRPASVQWFARIASDYFGVPCSAEQFVGQWFTLPERERSALGGANCLLGQSTFCGEKVWDRQSKIRLRIGPMRRAKFADFLPGGGASKSLASMFQLMVGATFDCEVRLVLDRRDVRPAALGRLGDPAMLGWQSWCGDREPDEDAEDTAYLIQAGAPACNT